MKTHLLCLILFLQIILYYSQNQSIIKIQNNMTTTSFTTSFKVNQTPTEVFQAIQDFRAWWSMDIEGKTNVLNEIFFYHYKDVHLCKIKLTEQITDKKLVYLVTENQFNFTKDQSEWVNTKLIFEIESQGTSTQLTFTHEGLIPTYECYQVCEDAWTSYIQGSLNSLITTGIGKPNPKEGGLNAELVEKWGLPKK